MKFLTSIITRLILVVLVLFIAAFAIRHMVVLPILQEEIAHLAEKQQQAMVSYVAKHIEGDVQNRLALLSGLSKEIKPDLLLDNTLLDDKLETFQKINPSFNYGLMLLGKDGKKVLADYPEVPIRENRGYADIEWFKRVLKEKTSIAGKPYRESASGYMLHVMAAPVFDENQNVIAVLCGLTLVNSPSFLDTVGEAKVGEKGILSIVSLEDKLYIASSDNALMFKAFSPDNPLYKKIANGFQDSVLSPDDEEKRSEIVSVAYIPSADWYVVAMLPDSEVYAGPDKIFKMLKERSYLVLAVAVFLLFFIFRYMFAPLLEASKLIKQMADGRVEPQPIPVVRNDEVGELISGFNAFVEKTKRFDEQLKVLIDGLPTAMLLHRDGVIQYVNRSFRALIDAEDDEKIEGLKMLSLVTPNTMERAKIRLDIAYHRVNKKPVEYQMKRFDGSTVWIEARANVVTYEGQDTVLTIMIDVEERKRHEMLLKMQKQEFELRFDSEKAKVHRLKEEREKQERYLIQQSKLATMGNMIGVIAHQLKQPLNAMSMLCANLVDKYDDNDLDKKGVNDFQDKMSGQIIYMSETINDFRNFFKPNKKIGDFDLTEAVNAVLKMLDRQLLRSSIKVEIISQQGVVAHGFINDFKQVIINILANAVDAIAYQKNTHPKISIVIEKTSSGSYVSITDNAGGVDEALLPNKLFDEHVSTKGSSGTGIGLSIVKMIVEGQLKGKVTVKNIEAENGEKGAKFEITLPRMG